jgi:hypothetical protein
LSKELQRKLPYLAAAAVWARGPIFQRIARQIRRNVANRQARGGPGIVTVEDAEREFDVASGLMRGGCNVQFLAGNDDESGNLFDIVGGNDDAKASLEDALALDPVRRTLLSSFGLSPSTGILLYGPPGTGKYTFYLHPLFLMDSDKLNSVFISRLFQRHRKDFTS